MEIIAVTTAAQAQSFLDMVQFIYQNDEVCERISLDNMYAINANSTVNKKLSYLSFSCRSSKYGFQATLKNKDNFASEIIDKLSYAQGL